MPYLTSWYSIHAGYSSKQLRFVTFANFSLYCNNRLALPYLKRSDFGPNLQQAYSLYYLIIFVILMNKSTTKLVIVAIGLVAALALIAAVAIFTANLASARLKMLPINQTFYLDMAGASSNITNATTTSSPAGGGNATK
jgi:hypothetical protein